jgi:hypothetical protein
LSIAGTRGDVLLTLDHVGKSVAPQYFARMMHALLLCLACLACDMHMVCCLAPMRWQQAVQRKRKKARADEVANAAANGAGRSNVWDFCRAFSVIREAGKRLV